MTDQKFANITNTESTTIREMLLEVYQQAIKQGSQEEDTPMRDETGEANHEEELCTICYTSELTAEQCITLDCSHTFHLGCIKQLFSHKWSTLRISFGFLQCPQCKAEITGAGNGGSEIEAELAPLLALKSQVEHQALRVARSQGLDKEQPDEAALLKHAMHQCAFYQCSKCVKPYFGGMQDCQAQLGVEESVTSKEDLMCKDCQLKEYGAGQAICEEHGTKHIDWKCLFCCSVAVYFCYGTHYMCQRCHDEYVTPPSEQVELRDCNGQDCPLGVPHPSANADYKKSTFPLGCNLCHSSDKKRQLPSASFVIQVSINEEEEVKAVLPQHGGIRTTEEQREMLQRERQERLESRRQAQLRLRQEKAQALIEKSIREKQARDNRLNTYLHVSEKYATMSSSSSESNSPKKALSLDRPAEEQKMEENPQRPMTTAAEQRRQKLIEKNAAIAERKRLNFIKIHEEREAKIAALNAKLGQGLDSSTNAAKKKEFAKKLTANNLSRQRPQTAVQMGWMPKM